MTQFFYLGKFNCSQIIFPKFDSFATQKKFLISILQQVNVSIIS